MCKIYGYARVSTSERSAKQDYERQKYLFEKSGIMFDKMFEEHISGGVKGNQREQFNKMLDILEPDDIVCFSETSRFGRNYIDCFEMIDLITQTKKATVKFLSNNIELKGGEKMNPYTWLTVSNFFIMDEFLKRQIGYNTSNALKARKAAGVALGRKKSDNYDEQVAELKKCLKNGYTAREIWENREELGITYGRSRVYELVKNIGGNR